MPAIVFFLAAMLAYAAPAKKPVVPSDACNAKALERKDCLLKLSTYQIQISRLKVNWNDGRWTGIADAPMPDEKFDWEKIEAKKFGNRMIVQFWIWDGGAGET